MLPNDRELWKRRAKGLKVSDEFTLQLCNGNQTGILARYSLPDDLSLCGRMCASFDPPARRDANFSTNVVFPFASSRSIGWPKHQTPSSHPNPPTPAIAAASPYELSGLRSKIKRHSSGPAALRTATKKLLRSACIADRPGGHERGVRQIGRKPEQHGAGEDPHEWNCLKPPFAEQQVYNGMRQQNDHYQGRPLQRRDIFDRSQVRVLKTLTGPRRRRECWQKDWCKSGKKYLFRPLTNEPGSAVEANSVHSQNSTEYERWEHFPNTVEHRRCAIENCKFERFLPTRERNSEM